LDRIVSVYMGFYMLHCRPNADAPNVFQTLRGCIWHRATGNIKAYLTARGIDTEQIEPTGRFVHGTRSIGLAVYAAHVDFDDAAIREYAILMRHSLDTIQRVYLPFLKIHQARKAIRRMSTMRGPSMTLESNAEETQQARTRLHLLPLKPPSAMVRSCVNQQLSASYASTVPAIRPRYELRDASTQTEDPDVQLEAPKSQHLTSSFTPPTCTLCSKQMLLFGPAGQKREKTSFGRFFYECAECSDGRPRKTSRFLALGYCPPAGVKTHSSKPRNLKRIEAHILHTTGCAVDYSAQFSKV
jgi:hypothetical protein